MTTGIMAPQTFVGVRIIGAIATLGIVVGCAVRSDPINLYDGPTRSEDQVAIIDNGDLVMTVIRADKNGQLGEVIYTASGPPPSQIRLEPGTYSVIWGRGAGCTPAGMGWGCWPAASGSVTRQFQPGHVYKVELGCSFLDPSGKCRPYMEDVTTGLVIPPD